MVSTAICQWPRVLVAGGVGKFLRCLSFSGYRGRREGNSYETASSATKSCQIPLQFLELIVVSLLQNTTAIRYASSAKQHYADCKTIMSSKEDHAEWLNETMTTMTSFKKATQQQQESSKSSSRRWNKRTVRGARRELYDATKDKYCPLRFNKTSRRRRRMDNAIHFASVASTSSTHKTTKTTRPHTSSGRRTPTLNNSSILSQHQPPSQRSTASPQRSSVMARSSIMARSSKARPSTAGPTTQSQSSTASRHRRVRKRPLPTAGITYQQSSGQSGAHDDLRVVYKIIDREAILLRIKKNATQFLAHHRWEAVKSMDNDSAIHRADSVESIDSYGKPLNRQTQPNPTKSKGTVLVEAIRNDLVLLRNTSMKVIYFIYSWRQDQMLTLDERQNPTKYPPRPFVYNGHDYLLKMVHDLNFLKDVQPITNWLGAPVVRNPFALMSDDPMCIDNLDMQFDGSLADLASCAHLPPPPGLTLELDIINSFRKTDPLCIKWSSLVLLAQEAIYGKGTEGSSLMTGYTGTRKEGGGSSSRAGQSTTMAQMEAGTFQVTQSILSVTPNIIIQQEEPADDDVLTGTVATTTVAHISEKQEENKIESKEGGGRHKTSMAKVKNEDRVRVIGKVKTVLSQNASLRKELMRLRKQLEMERNTVYQLEKEEHETRKEGV